MYSIGFSMPVLADCRFVGNYTLWGGGAICNGDVYPGTQGVHLELIS